MRTFTVLLEMIRSQEGGPPIAQLSLEEIRQEKRDLALEMLIEEPDLLIDAAHQAGWRILPPDGAQPSVATEPQTPP